MEVFKTIYVALIEGVKSFVPVEAKEITSKVYIITYSRLFDPNDNSSVFQFIPGDKVSCRIETKKDCKGSEEQILVADSLIESSALNRNLQMIKFIIVDQNGVLSHEQMNHYNKELVVLKKEVNEGRRDSNASSYHPNILRWAGK